MNKNASVDNELIAYAIEISGLKTKKEVINIALREFVEKRKRKNIALLKGQIEFAEGYDCRNLR